AATTVCRVLSKKENVDESTEFIGPKTKPDIFVGAAVDPARNEMMYQVYSINYATPNREIAYGAPKQQSNLNPWVKCSEGYNPDDLIIAKDGKRVKFQDLDLKSGEYVAVTNGTPHPTKLNRSQVFNMFSNMIEDIKKMFNFSE
ncbi:MAG: hypothetical protein AB1782_15250, partial [Cyanobacteriota bacterium]